MRAVFNTEHHELVVSASDLTQYWPLLTWHRDEPVSEPSDLGSLSYSKLARQHVKVVLWRGRQASFLQVIRNMSLIGWQSITIYYQPQYRDQVIQPLLESLPYSMRKVKTAARNITASSAALDELVWYFNRSLKEQLLSSETKMAIDLDSSREFNRWLKTNPQRDNLSAMLYLDTKIWLPDNLLMKGDKMTMAASLESRIPMLDYKLIEYTASIPSGAKIKSFKPKYLLKHAFTDLLPAPILTRKKMGFNVPTGVWFRAEQRNLINTLLLSERMRSRGYFQMDFIERMLRDHLDGKTNYQAQIFTLASLELWFRVFIDPPNLEMPQGSVEELLSEEYTSTPSH